MASPCREARSRPHHEPHHGPSRAPENCLLARRLWLSDPDFQCTYFVLLAYWEKRERVVFSLSQCMWLLRTFPEEDC